MAAAAPTTAPAIPPATAPRVPPIAPAAKPAASPEKTPTAVFDPNERPARAHSDCPRLEDLPLSSREREPIRMRGLRGNAHALVRVEGRKSRKVRNFHIDDAMDGRFVTSTPCQLRGRT